MSRYRSLFAFILLLCVAAIVVNVQRPMRRGLDLAGGMRIVYEARPEKGQEFTNQTRQTIVRILQKRVSGGGVVEGVVQPKPPLQFIVEIPDVKNKEQLAQDLTRASKLEFRYFQKVKSPRNGGAPYNMDMTTQDGQEVYRFSDPLGKEIPNSQVIAESPVVVTGADLKDNATGDIQGLKSVVKISFKKDGAEKFADFTRRHRDEYLAIILNGEILSVPKINEAILNGEAVITGNFTPDQAQQLANDLNAGALPVPLVMEGQTVVEATLGRQYVDQSVKAGVWGLGLVVAFMILYYHLPGFLATLALGLYALFSFAIYKLMGVTMTLPGLAGFILSIGMAVDANILIFERMKEELRAGKTLHSAIDAGFSRAWTAILDSNVCTLITCTVLMVFSSGPVQGFAKTLALGVLVSMFTAITATRTLLHIVTNARWAQNPNLYGLTIQWGQRGGTGKGFDFIGKTVVWFTFSAVMIAIGIGFLAGGGLKKGIDFTNGSMIQLSAPATITTPQVNSAMTSLGVDPGQVQIAREAGKTTVFVRTLPLKLEQSAAVRTQLPSKIEGVTVVSIDTVGASISAEVTRNAIIATILACIGILLYLSLRFAQSGYVAGFRFGACALAALIHDILVVLGASAIFGKAFGWEIDGSYVTAVLTVVGFSVHDTIVIFDRIRENQKLRLKGETFDQLVNRSILQSFARSVNTSVTVIMVLTMLLIFGGAEIRHFNAVMLVGIITGTYSSIFNASPLLVIWDRVARKQRGQLSPAELRPLVEKPSKEALLQVGASGNGSGEEQEQVETAESAQTRMASKGASASKRKKRRF